MDFRAKIDNILRKFPVLPCTQHNVKYISGEYVALIRNHLYLTTVPLKDGAENEK